MGNYRPTDLTKRGGIWHIDKLFRGTRIRESTSTGDLAKAQELLAKRIDQIVSVIPRPSYTLEEE